MTTQACKQLSVLQPHELEAVAGGMMNLRDSAAKPSIKAADDGFSWVPEGTVKVYLAGVQIG